MNDLFLDEIVRPDDSGGDDGSARRSGRADRDRRRKQRRRRNLIALVISLAVLGGAAWAIIQFVVPVLTDFADSTGQQEATDYPGPGHGSVEIVIPPSASGTQMASVLVDSGVVASTSAFTRAFGANPDAVSIQPGTYRMLLEMKAEDAVNYLLNAENRVQTKVTIVEGLRVDQTLDKLSSVTTVPVADFQAAMADTAATGLPAEAGGNYEGWLFPATYSFEPGTTPAQMIAQMVGITVQNLDQRGVAPEDRMTVLTKASLVEREAKSAEDRAKVARAIENRLEKDMILQIDASVAYGLNKPGTELTRADLDTDGPYNTYTRSGLPPGPIAAPSLTSIDAVLSPAEGPWLFWVTINHETGETLFAVTNAEHEANKAQAVD